MLKYSDVGEILSLIDSSSCDEVILEAEGIKLVVRRGGAAASTGGPSPHPAPSVTPASGAVARPAASPLASPPKTSSTGGDGFIGAPMVGTFYRATSPDDPPFVEIGSNVNVGDPICVIEVMKLFTTVHSEIVGTITQIGVDDAQMVEFGQMIFMIDPA
jgi:acetyl-CoA carboxylase biotin carboxyl carrier protein